MGPTLDGCPPHMCEFPPHMRFEPANLPPVNIAEALRDSGAQILINYLPVGSQRATEHYAQACLDAGAALVNCIPVFIASDPTWARRFQERGLPIVGDDIKAQLGATITHRTLARLFHDRGVRIDSTYQLNTAGNTDFLNMLARDRLASKKISKTEAVQSQLDVPLDPGQIHISPSDFVPFQKDNKVCFLRIEGTGFGGIPLHVELRLSVEDSPNSAGVVVDAVRCCKLALDAGMAGPIEPAAAWTMKHPPRQMIDTDARLAMEEFIAEAVAARRSTLVPSPGNPGEG
jgi:myo-inositol-1-phosphate synthase